MKPLNIKPSALSLLLEARGELETYAPMNLTEYEQVIVELRRKNHSFGKIAEWLSERLGRPVNKGGVYRVYSDWEEAEMNREPEVMETEDHEGVSNEELMERVIEEFTQHLVETVDAYEKVNRCSGMAVESLGRAAQIIKQRWDDEQSAEEADIAKSSIVSSDKSASP